MAVTQNDINTLQNTIEADGTVPAGVKGQVQGLLYTVSKMIFGNASNPPKNGYPQ
jgi:hypothetical protein